MVTCSLSPGFIGSLSLAKSESGRMPSVLKPTSTSTESAVTETTVPWRAPSLRLTAWFCSNCERMLPNDSFGSLLLDSGVVGLGISGLRPDGDTPRITFTHRQNLHKGSPRLHPDIHAGTAGYRRLHQRPWTTNPRSAARARPPCQPFSTSNCAAANH